MMGHQSRLDILDRLGPGRICSEAAVSDALHPDDKTGFSPKVSIDLHKLLAARKVINEDVPLTAEITDGLRLVISLGASTSPRLNLLFRSNARLRTGYSVFPNLSK